MTEEQEKQKPKATLIKHKKEEPTIQKPVEESTEKADDKTDKKKIVVVKKKVLVKKVAPKVVPRAAAVKNREEPEPDQPAAQAPQPPVAEVESPKAPSVPSETVARPEPPREMPKPAPRQEERTEQRPPYRPPQQRPQTGGSQPYSQGGYRSGDQQRYSRPYNQQGSTGNYRGGQSTYRGPGQGGYQGGQRPYGGQGSTGYREAGGNRFPDQRNHPGTGNYSQNRFGPRPMGPRPPRPGAGPGGQKPGFGPKGRPGTKPSITDETKTGPKKFFKAKKKDNYQKRDKLQEKELQVKKKVVTRLNPVPKSIDIMEVITVSDLAKKMNLKASELISKLMAMGMMVTINQQIDAETASILAQEYECKVNIVSLYDETLIESEKDREEDLLPRPPIVTIMGHVDHGKTKLLDAIRTSNVVAGEFGGITQHIGAYMVDLPQGKIIFLDTPGHEAFTMMRARGANVTDIVILVVAANDGVMPQTVEAINHAKAANAPIIVAINKIDLPEANPERVKQQLSDYDLVPEEWGGKTLYVQISALKKMGIENLLETILLQAEIMNLRANYTCNAEGKVIESKIDHGRGIVATVLIERGTLKVGDTFVAGIFPGKVRAMFNDKGEKLEEATPSMPVEILGFTGIPNSGDPFQVTDNEKVARQIGDKRQELKKTEEAKNVKKITLDNLYDSIQEGAVQDLKVIIKGDVYGSVEALKTSLEKLSTKEIRLSVIHASAGAINEGDIQLASASSAIIIGFHVRPTPKAQQLADIEKVEVRKYNIIYDAVEDIRSAMEGLLAPDLKEETIGLVEVRDTFKVPKIGLIAGCYVTSGKVKRNGQVHVIRDGIEIHTGKIVSLKRFKDDAREVDSGFECGIGIENFTDVKVGDQFEVFEIREIAKKLSEPQNG